MLDLNSYAEILNKSLMSEGGTALDGAFHRICSFNDDLIQQLFTYEVFSLLLAEKLIGLSLMQKILSWRHTGFNVHSKVRARAEMYACILENVRFGIRRSID